MKLFDENFKNNHFQYFIQCAIAAGVFMVIMALLDVLLNATVVASLGATSFIVFTMPHKQRSKPKYIIGGYLVGCVVGSIGAFVNNSFPYSSIVIVGGLVIGFAIYFMTILNVEHPPAAAFALGLALEGTSIYTVAVVLSSAIVMMILKYVFRKWLIDLL